VISLRSVLSPAVFWFLSKSYNDRKLVHNVLLSGIAPAVNAGVEPSRDGLTNKNVSLGR
jgi:hypothetical protein